MGLATTNDGVYYDYKSRIQESRDAWLKTYDVDAGNKEFDF